MFCLEKGCVCIIEIGCESLKHKCKAPPRRRGQLRYDQNYLVTARIVKLTNKSKYSSGAKHSWTMEALIYLINQQEEIMASRSVVLGIQGGARRWR